MVRHHWWDLCPAYMVLPSKAMPGVVVIEDVSRDEGGRSITNGAELVIEDLLRRGQLQAKDRLFYYDSDGQLHQLLHDGFRFLGFAPFGEEKLEALRRAKA
jgi:hypothetical protein